MGQNDAATAANFAAAHQAALAARILQAQQQNHSGIPVSGVELALHQQLFSHQQQLLHQKILEEQYARNRDFLLMSETEREKQLGLIFHQVRLILQSLNLR